MKLKKFSNEAGTVEGYRFFCPGCQQLHAFNTKHPTTVWSFDGNTEAPTFSPSLRVLDGGGTICHLFLKGGTLEFCTDSPHDLAGKSMPLPDLPEWAQ